MTLMIRQIAAHAHLSEHRALESLARAVPASTVAGVLAEYGAVGRRTRKLPGLVTVFLCLAMNLHTGDCLEHAFRQLVLGLRWRWPDPAAWRVSKGALCQARYRLRARPLALLFRRVCRPLATATTPGAFRFGLRLMALDGTTLDVPDTAANVRACGRQPSPRGTSAWPRVQVVALRACGTHAVCAAGIRRGDTDERAAGRRLLRAVRRGMLVLWDRGCHRCATIAAAGGVGGACGIEAAALARCSDGQGGANHPDAPVPGRLAAADGDPRDRPW